MTAPLYNPGQPYMLTIPYGFTPGKIAHVTGTFSPTASSLVIKFQSGPYGDPNDDVGLCLYGRCSENIMGLNSFTRNAGWGTETPIPSQGLFPGQSFELTILCDPMMFKIAFNRQHLAELNHRLDPSALTHLNVASGPNDLTINCLYIEDPSSPRPAPSPVASQSGTPSYPSYNQPSYGPPSNQPQYQNYGGQYGPSPQGGYKPKDKGLMGLIGGAGAAVAGALGASHVLGKSKHHGGYPGQQYTTGYPSNQYGGYPGHSPHKSGGGLMNKAMAIGGGVLAAKTAKSALGGGGKALKYGLPVAGAGLGGYMLTKGISSGFHCGGSSSSGSSEEEEE